MECRFDINQAPIVSQSQDTQIFDMKYPVTCKIYTGYHDTSHLFLLLS